MFEKKDDIVKRRAKLSPDKRALLEKRLRGAGSETPRLHTIPRRAETGPAPLSFAQQRLWFLDQLSPGSAAYTIFISVGMQGAINVVALSQSLNAVVRRHETWRTVFPSMEGRPVQVTNPARPLRLPLVDLRDRSEHERMALALRLSAQESRRPFDLARGPLVRATLIRLRDTEHVLLLAIHHIIFDRWSYEILISELVACYEAFAAGRPVSLPALPIQYADYACWQRQWLAGEMSEAQLAYWRQQLAGAPPALALPADRPRPAIQIFHGAQHFFELSSALTGALKALSQREGATLFMTMLATFQALLARYSRQDDIVIGSPIANRTLVETEGLIGFFANTLVLRTNLSGNPSVRELLGRARRVCLDAYAHQDLPFEQLVEELQPRRDLSHTPIFQVVLQLLNTPEEVSQLSSLTLTPLQEDSGTAEFDLTLDIWERRETLYARLGYNTDLFDDATIARMSGHFRTLLEGVVADPDRRLDSLPLLTEAEYHQLIIEWNETRARYPQDAGLYSLFAAQAARTPDAVAVAFAHRPTTNSATPHEASDHRPTGGARTTTRDSQPHSFKMQHLTYAELDRRAHQLAQRLRALGVAPETCVGLCVERSPDLAIGMLGILKAGGVCLPLDPAYPAERIAFMLEDAQAPTLLIQKHLLDHVIPEYRPPPTAERPTPALRFPSLKQVIQLDAGWKAIDLQDAAKPDGCVRPSQAAYTIYTSGSTGRPKGVLLTHKALVNYTLAAIQQLELRPDDRVLQFAPISFDVLIEELFPAWSCGAAVVLHGEGLLAPSSDFMRLIEQAGVTVVELPASYWHEWVYELSRLAARPPRALRRVILGCEKPSVERLAAWQQWKTPLVYVYGLTETTITSTLYKPALSAEGADSLFELPIGRPIANTHIYALDRHLRPTPIGVPGELHIGGSGLARGYLGRSDLTAAAFVPNPFVKGSGVRGPGSDPDPRPPIPDPRLYRTGDLARYRPDGNVEFLGRIDRQVKNRGFRIELGEIEATLAQHPAVREAVVVNRQDLLRSEQQLVAYIVPLNSQGSMPSPAAPRPAQRRSDHGAGERRPTTGNGQPLAQPSTPTSQELRDFLRARLPDYMTPNAFILLDALPLTSNGKIDRDALPAPDQRRPDLETALAAPRTPIEQAVAAIWLKVLRVEQVGIHDNFFELGGHSLLATQVISRLHQSFQVELPLRTLFEQPTIAALAQAITRILLRSADGPATQAAETADGGAGVAHTPAEQRLRETGAQTARTQPILGRQSADFYPLSFAQQRLWFLDQLAPGSAAYNIPAAVRLVGALDIIALQRSINEIIRRHEALRTTFPIRAGQPVQVIAPSLVLALPLADLRDLPEAARAATLLRLKEEESRRSFELSSGSLVRASVLRLGVQEHILLFTIHHIVFDNWSMGVLIREFVALYQAFSAGKPSPLSELPIQYADFACWQRQWLQGSVLEAQVSYWKRRLAGAPPLLALPTDYPRPPIQRFHGAAQSLALSGDLAAALAALSRQTSATLFMTLLASFKVVLYHFTGQEDILVGSPIANRNHIELEGLIGFFVNTLALRTELSGDPGFRALLDRVRTGALEAYDHQDLPFEQLVNDLQIERSTSYSPVFQVMFVLENASTDSWELPGLALSALKIDRAAAHFDLHLGIEETAHDLTAVLTYNTDLFTSATIRRLLDHYEAVLRKVVIQPDINLSALVAILADMDRQQRTMHEKDLEAARIQKKGVRRRAISLSNET